MAKSFQSIAVGVVSLVIAGAKFFGCLQLIDIGNAESCSVGAEDTLMRYILMAEPLRMAAVWTSFGLLSCGYARGGKDELHALEAVRLDAADGKIDGIIDETTAEDMVKAWHDDDDENDPELDEVDDVAMYAANERARQKLGVQARSAAHDVMHGESVRWWGAKGILACHVSYAARSRLRPLSISAHAASIRPLPAYSSGAAWTCASLLYGV
jgi:hypothetical protein